MWAVALCVLAIFSRRGGHVVEVALSIAGVAYGALLGVFLLGTLTKRATEIGAIAGLVTGFTLNVLLWMQKGPFEVGHLFVVPVIAYPWYVPIGSMVTFIVGYSVSLLTGNRQTGNVATAESSAG